MLKKIVKVKVRVEIGSRVLKTLYDCCKKYTESSENGKTGQFK